LDINETARQLGISPDGVRKRIARGTLQATKVAGRWDIVLDTGQDKTGPRPGQQDMSPVGDSVRTEETLVTALQEQVKTLTQQLVVKDHQIAELLIVTRQAQAQLPAPAPSRRRWWQFLRS